MGTEQEQSKLKIYLTYPKKLVEEPVIYWIGKKFDVVTNIRGASISDEIGLVALEIDGAREEIEKAVEWLKNQGVKVEPIEKNVIE
jgi:ABC-type methionine transport system ATPase subunit